MDFSNPSEKNQYNKLVFLVNNILNLQKKYDKTKIERDKELYEQQIMIADAQIDMLVHDLYGLTGDKGVGGGKMR